MNRYVVAWINFFDNELEQQYISANSEINAIRKSKQDIIDISDGWYDDSSLQNLKGFAFDADGMISVLRIK